MAKPPAVRIPVRLDKGSVEKDAKGVRDSLTSSLGGVAVAAAGAVAAYKALSAAMGAAIRIGKEAVKLSTIQIEAERKLIAAARMRGEFTQENFEELQKLNAETQRATGIGDEQQLQMQAQMAMMGLRNDQLAEATRATIGLSEATGQNLNSAMRIVVRTYAGNTSALKRYGIQAKNSAEAMKILLQNFEIAKSRSTTLAGKTAVLEAAYGDLLEVLGSNVIKSEALKGGVDAITNAVERLTRFLSSQHGQNALDLFFRKMLSMSAMALRAWVGMNKAAQTLKDTLTEPGDPGAAPAGTVEAAAMVGGQLMTAREMRAELKGGVGPFRRGELTQALKLLVAKRGGRLVGQADVFVDTITEQLIQELTAAANAPAGTGAPAAGLRGAPGAPGAGVDAKAPARGDIMTAHVAAFEAEKQIREDIADLRARELEATAEFNAKQTDLETQRLIAQRENLDAINADRKRFFDQFATISIQGMSQFISGMIVSAAQGRLSFGAAIKGLFATLIDGVGNMMIQLGTAAILLGKAGTVAPWLAAITGGPLGVKAGIGLVVGGAVLKGAAGALRSSSAAATEAAGAAAGNAAARRAPTAVGIDTEPTGFDPRRGRPENRTTVINVSFPGTLPGAEERQARAIQRLLGADDEFSLLPAGG